jgi:curved DNA-binding protein CbpA
MVASEPMKPGDDADPGARSPAEERLAQPIGATPTHVATLPPDALEEDAEELVRQWAAMLDRVDYLAVLRLPADGAFDDDALRRAFHAFALAFHPDRWRDAGDDVRRAANAVYCLGAEAYKVLQDPLLRKRYLRLRASGARRLRAEEIAQSERHEEGASIESLVRSPQSLAFAKRADELLAQGDLKQARLQLQLACAKESNNARLEERLAELNEQIRALGPPSGRQRP